MKKKLKIAILGAGHIANNFHIPAWKQNKECEVVSLCDKNLLKAKITAKKYNIKNIYNDFDIMLKKEKIDILNICTPPYLHFENLVKGIRSNKNILIEKPFVTSKSQIEKIKKKIKNKKILIRCSLHQRHRAISIAVKNAITKKLIGDIYYINIVHRKFRAIPKHSKVFSSNKLSKGGPIIDLGSHYFDLVFWILGYPKIIKSSCFTAKKIFNKTNMHHTPFKYYNNEEIGIGEIYLRKKLIKFELCYVLNSKDEKVFIEFFGSKGNIKWPYNQYYILTKNKLYSKKFNYKEHKASFKQVDDFVKDVKKKRNKNMIYDIDQLVNLIDDLYLSSKERN